MAKAKKENIFLAVTETEKSGVKKKTNQNQELN